MLEYAVNNWEAKCVCRQQINPAPCQVCLSPLDSLCSRKCPPSGLHTLPPPWSVRMPRVARRRAYLRSLSLSLSLSRYSLSLHEVLRVPSRVGSAFQSWIEVPKQVAASAPLFSNKAPKNTVLVASYRRANAAVPIRCHNRGCGVRSPLCCRTLVGPVSGWTRCLCDTRRHTL